MSDCGNYVVIIKDKAEFQHRIRESFKGTKFKFLCGDVEYRRLQKNGIPINISKSHHLVLKAENPVVISLRDMNIAADCFILSASPAKYYLIIVSSRKERQIRDIDKRLCTAGKMYGHLLGRHLSEAERSLEIPLSVFPFVC